MSTDGKIWEQVFTHVLLFLLVMGMSSTVDIRVMKSQLRNVKAISIGLMCQFLLLPFLGYIIVMLFALPPTIGVTLLMVVSSPSGSYSNWWCSLLNADLALSVSVTTLSTILSIIFLPLNLFVYSYAAYNDSETESGSSVLGSIDFGVIFISIGVVIAGIATGMFCSWKFDNPRWHKLAYIGGNISGIALVLFSIVLSFAGGSSSTTSTALVTGLQYFAITLPCIFVLVLAAAAATLGKLPKPERLTTAVECAYQNPGISTSAALSLFGGDQTQLQQAMRVPFVYGLVQMVSICVFLLIGWKLGWSKAPRDENLCTVITKSYEIVQEDGEKDEKNAEEDEDSDEEEGGEDSQTENGEGGSNKGEDKTNNHRDNEKFEGEEDNTKDDNHDEEAPPY